MEINPDTLQKLNFMWANKTFGSNRPLAVAEHLRLELIEVVTTISKVPAFMGEHGVTVENHADLAELADVYLLFSGLAAACGVNMSTVIAAAYIKHIKNTERTWTKPQDDTTPGFHTNEE